MAGDGVEKGGNTVCGRPHVQTGSDTAGDRPHGTAGYGVHVVVGGGVQSVAVVGEQSETGGVVPSSAAVSDNLCQVILVRTANCRNTRVLYAFCSGFVVLPITLHCTRLRSRVCFSRLFFPTHLSIDSLHSHSAHQQQLALRLQQQEPLAPRLLPPQTEHRKQVAHQELLSQAAPLPSISPSAQMTNWRAYLAYHLRLEQPVRTAHWAQRANPARELV